MIDWLIFKTLEISWKLHELSLAATAAKVLIGCTAIEVSAALC